MPEIPPNVRDFAIRYTAAWCSHNAAAVALHYTPDGSLTINNGTPAIGRPAIAAAAESFITALPDLQVYLDWLVPAGDRMEYHWTLTGSNTAPGGTGNFVRISGFESWQLSSDCLIASSRGSFDADDYARQISGM